MAKKIDMLLKKADSFEKLASNTDRIALLRSIAWDDKDEIEELNNPKPTGIPAPDTMLGGSSPNPDIAPPGELVSSKMPAKSVVEYPTIDKNKQEALSRIVTVEGLGLPLKNDGKFGPETKSALTAFKKKFSLENTLDDARALEYAQMLVNMNPKYKI